MGARELDVFCAKEAQRVQARRRWKKVIKLTLETEEVGGIRGERAWDDADEMSEIAEQQEEEDTRDNESRHHGSKDVEAKWRRVIRHIPIK